MKSKTYLALLGLFVLALVASAAHAHGVDLTAFPFVTKGETPGPSRIAAVGRLVEKKGFGDLLTAVARLVAAGRDVRVDLVGTGPLEATLRQQVGEVIEQDEHRVDDVRIRRTLATCTTCSRGRQDAAAHRRDGEGVDDGV